MSVRSSLNQLYQHLKMNCPAVDIIIVSSVYEATQFETVPNLCTTAEGCMVLLDDCPVDENNQICGNHTYVQKTNNSLFTCSTESLERILQLVRNRTVLVCGVTTVSCVSMAVSNLRKNAFCNKVLIARDAVASRKSNASREADLLLEWVAATTSEGVANIEVYDHWQRLMFAE